MPIEILVLAGLIVINGVFAMSEMALVAARRGRLQVLVDKGSHGAAAALALHQQPNRFLSTVQVGITSIGILSGIVGEAALADPLRERLIRIGMEGEAASVTATVLVVVVITYFAIVFGELVPKRLGQVAPETTASRVALPLTYLAVAAKPFVGLLSGSTDLLLRVLRVRTAGAQAMTEEEIHILLAEGSASGVIAEHEHTMVRNVFRLDERSIGSLMTPRTEIVFVDLDDPPESALRKIIESKHLRFPVCRGGSSEIVGVIDARQVLEQLALGKSLDFGVGLKPPVFVPESLSATDLLEKLRDLPTSMAVVLGEYGEVKGLVTPQDVLEAITGQLAEPSADEAWAIQRADGSWLLDGLISVHDLKDRLGLAVVPEEGLGHYNTLAGMVMLVLGKVPRTGDVAVWLDWRFEVVDMDGNRIDKVLAARSSAG